MERSLSVGEKIPLGKMMTLVHYDQLKQLSDPLRCRIVSLLIPKSYTGQQLSQELEFRGPKFTII